MGGCIDLAARFGRRYRIEPEPSYRAEHGDGARGADPWLLTVICRHGHVFPFGGRLLAASVDGHEKVAGRLRRLRCCRVVQDGDFGELTATFDVADFARVARIMGPRRRRQVTPEERARLVARLQGRPEVTPQRPTQGEHSGRSRDAGAQGESEHVGRQLGLFDG